MLKEYETRYPNLVRPIHNVTPTELLPYIGITVPLPTLSRGYLNLYPQDFIVEERDARGILHTVEPAGNATPPRPEETSTLYGDLIKVGLSTLEAVSALARSLRVSEKQIGYAGIKDKGAITSQSISIRRADPDAIAKLSVPGLVLKNMTWGKGTHEKGKLFGNRFTIVVRADAEVAADALTRHLATIRDGFYNFYYFQRFGTPRLQSHILGKHILQKNYDETIRVLLCENGAQNVPLIRELRARACREFGNWRTMAEIFRHLPYTFRQELEVLRFLAADPRNFFGALLSIRAQGRFWVYSYASYLANLHLSTLIQNGKPLPPVIPLLLHPDYQTVPTYHDALASDDIGDVSGAATKIFGYDPIHSKNSIPTTVRAVIHAVRSLGKIIVLDFELPPAAYATTLLAHLFDITRGIPVPKWVDQTKIDSKEILGTGSVAAVEKILGTFMFTKADPVSEPETNG